MNQNLSPEGPPTGAPRELSVNRPDVRTGKSEIPNELRRQDAIRSAEAVEGVRQEIAGTISPRPPLTDRQRALLGDFADTGRLEGNKLILPENRAQELVGIAKDFVKSRPALLIKPWYFFKGNRTATRYNSPFARNRSTQTSIRTLSTGEQVFLIDPRGSALHRIFDTVARRAFGHPARKVSLKEWKPLMHDKSEIPVLQPEDAEQGATFPYGNVVAVPFIGNVNGADFFGHKDIDYPEEYRWAGEAGLEDKIQVGEEAMRVAHDIHSRGKAWGEMATHNSLIVKKPDGEITIIPADTEVQYDDSIPDVEKYARDVFDLTVTIAGGLNKSEGITGGGYDAVVSRLFGAYENKEVIENVGRLVKPLSRMQRFLYKQYEGKRYNGLPYDQYLQITRSMQKAAQPSTSTA